MFRQAVTIILMVCFLFQISCATTKKVPIITGDYYKLTEEDTIYVTVKSGREYEMTASKFTNTHIEGIVIIRDDAQRRVSQEKLDIKLEDVDFITVKKSEFKWVPFRRGCLIGGGIGIVAAAIAIGAFFIFLIHAYSVSG